MKTLLPITLLLFVLQSFSQEIPRISINDSTYLELKTLKVESEIVGNVATTSYTMRFYNATNRILEGELVFPLGQGQAVTKFSMDVNGTMRDAVIVEKELGRVAYESTIRQQIDPGLLEVTKGNNYKARVYPIPAQGFKELRIEFEQELYISNENYIYEIPFNFKTPVDFELKIAIYGENQKYKIIEGKNLDLKFTRIQGVHYSKVSKSEWIANQSLKIELPVSTKEHLITYLDYFNLYKVIDPKTRLRQKPNHMTVLWDASCSMQYRNLEAEMKLLDKYFNYLDTVTVDFISFSNSVKTLKTFIVKDGNWNALKKQMKAIVYDGGTAYSNLNLSRLKTNEILFFTDGMFNLGDLKTNVQTPIYTINSVNAANHTFLENKATELSGKYINLRITDVKQAFEALKYDAYQFLGIVENNLVSDVYPKTRVNVNHDFSIAGKFKEATQIELLFGYGNTITEKIPVNIDKSLRNKLAKRLWAKKKLRYLNKNKEENKNAIIELAQKNHLITAFTSMIILDRLEDYVRYKIEPPKALRQDYKQRMENSVEDEVAKLEEIKEKRVALLEDYKHVMDWYNTDYPIVLKKPIIGTITSVSRTEPTTISQPTTTRSQNEPATTVNNTTHVVERPINDGIDTNRKIISGTIYDESGLPLAGVNIIKKGSNYGTQTDFDGNYAINAETGDVLNVSYVGYVYQEITISNETTISFGMDLDVEAIDEVVVTALGISRESRSLGYSTTTISSESVTQALQGRVSGVRIQQNTFQPGGLDNIIIRGTSSVSNNSSPLYIVDGEVVSGNVTKEMSSDGIASINVLNEASGTVIYGNRGGNGVIVITTKKGLLKHTERIEKLNKKINEVVRFKDWSPEANYLKQLSTTNTIEEAYELYLEIRKNYYNTPTFFIDVADFFEAKKEREIAIRILSNLAEIELDDHEVLRALAYKLESFKANDLALYVYKEVMKLRPEEPQSTRDLALAYENVGNYQKAFDLLFKIINGDLVEKDLDGRFHGIEQLAFIEAGHIYQRNKDKLKLTSTQEVLIKPITTDLRVVADWNHNNTDLDLYIENPKGLTISYKQQSTRYGDRLSEDMTEGYGPEEYLIKEALKGEYNIKLNYYSDTVQKISGPTVVKVTIFKNYGKENEIKHIRIYRLDKEEEEIQIGGISFI